MRPVVHRLRADYQGRVDVLSVNPKSMKAQKLAGQYGAIFTPTFVFVQSNGSIQGVIVGEADEERLRQELELLLHGSP